MDDITLCLRGWIRPVVTFDWLHISVVRSFSGFKIFNKLSTLSLLMFPIAVLISLESLGFSFVEECKTPWMAAYCS